jgi:uncharacterized protein (DUF362 family)
MTKVYDSKKQTLQEIIGRIAKEFNLSKQNKVFIKPNLGGRYPIIRGENTSYDIMNELCKTLKNSKCKEIVVGHTSLLNFGNEKYDFQTLMKHSGLEKLIKHPKVTLLNLDNTKRHSITTHNVSFEIPEIAKSHFYINLSSLKTHMETTVSLSLKNQIGLLTARERMRNHQADLNRYIAYLALAVKPHLNIIDGRIGMQGNGPHHGFPGNANIIVCGNDMVEVDSMACSLIGIDFNMVKHITFAIRENVGIPVTPEQQKIYRHLVVKFKRPQEYFQKYGFLKVWPNKACSGCIFSLSNAHKAIMKNPFKLTQFLCKLIMSHGMDIVMGKEAETNISQYSATVYAIGDCTKGFTAPCKSGNFLSGCPPTKNSIIQLLLKK